MQFFRLMGLYARMDAAWFLRDTKMCLLAMAADLLSSLAAVTGVYLLSITFDGVGGMKKDEVLFMLGYATQVAGLFLIFFTNGNSGHVSRIVGRGQLDHMIIQPVPLPTQFLTMGFIPVSGNSNMIAGLGVMFYALSRLGIAVTPALLGMMALQLLSSLAVLLGLSYLIGASAFWYPVACEEISTDAVEGPRTLSRYPLSGMPVMAQTALITAFPAGLLGWFPACAILGKTPLNLPAVFTALIACVLCTAAMILFRKGLKHYAKVGSFRYLPYGFRS